MAQPLYVLPLYSLLSTERQQLILEGPPEGSRNTIKLHILKETILLFEYSLTFDKISAMLVFTSGVIVNFFIH